MRPRNGNTNPTAKDGYPFKIEVRHVKGHAQDRPDAVGRHNVNALCDQAAKAARKTAERMQQIEKGIQR